MPSDQELLEGYDLHVSRMLAGTGDMAYGFAPIVHAIVVTDSDSYRMKDAQHRKEKLTPT